MNFKTISLFASIIVLTYAMGMAEPAVGSIVGTAHDFSGDAWSNQEICAPCHTPHNAIATAAPLWAHAATTSTYTVYASLTLNASVGQPSGISALCLSCHDDVLALADFQGGDPVANPGKISSVMADAALGLNLSNDHPISFPFNTALSTADGGLHDPSIALSGLGGTIATDMLFSGSMECASCHDPHGGVASTKLLRMSNAASALCLTCHNK